MDKITEVNMEPTSSLVDLEKYDVDDLFDEDDNIIVPTTYWGEFVYILYIIRYIFQHPKEYREQLTKLKSQINIFKFYLRQKQ